MVEIVLVRLAPPKLHVCNLEITPEMACTISVRLFVMLWPGFTVNQPLHCVVLVKELWVRSEKFDRLGPERRYRLGRVVQIDVETVGFVVIFHVSEDIVVDVAEELDFWFNAPVVTDVFQCRMMVEHATIPATHLMVGLFGGILNIVLL